MIGGFSYRCGISGLKKKKNRTYHQNRHNQEGIYWSGAFRYVSFHSCFKYAWLIDPNNDASTGTQAYLLKRCISAFASFKDHAWIIF